VGLLFAGSDTNTLANRISTVLSTLAVTIDSGPQAILQGISVTPTEAFVEVGRTVPFTATGQYSDAVDRDITSTVTWESSDLNVATINASGLAAGISVGHRYGSDEDYKQPAQLNVIPSTLVSFR
jgi:uncharacterized protein YjdB